MSKSYSEKLRDPRWQKRRLEIMQRDGFCCASCEDKASTLNVHHRYYVKGRDPWEYPDFALVTLCEECHKLKHEDDMNGTEWESMVNTLFPAASDVCGEFDLHCLVGLAKSEGATQQQCIAAMTIGMRHLWISMGLTGWEKYGRLALGEKTVPSTPSLG